MQKKPQLSSSRARNSKDQKSANFGKIGAELFFEFVGIGNVDAASDFDEGTAERR